MKKTCFSAIILCFILAFALCAFANDITVKVGGTAAVFSDAKPTIVEGRTMVPIRAVADLLSCNTYWDDETREAVVSRDAGNKRTILYISPDNGTAKTEVFNRADVFADFELVYSSVSTPDVPAQIISNRVFVPLRFISENLNCTVGWEDKTRTVSITVNPVPAFKFVSYAPTTNTATPVFFGPSDALARFAATDTAGSVYYIGGGNRLYKNDCVIAENVSDFTLLENTLYYLQNGTLYKYAAEASEIFDTNVISLVQKTAPLVYAKGDSEKGSVLCTDGYAFKFGKDVFACADEKYGYYYKIAFSGFSIFCVLLREEIGTGVQETLTQIQSTTAAVLNGKLYFSGYTVPGLFVLSLDTFEAQQLYQERLIPQAALDNGALIVYDTAATHILKDGALKTIAAAKATDISETESYSYILASGNLYQYDKKTEAITLLRSGVMSIVSSDDNALLLLEN